MSRNANLVPEGRQRCNKTYPSPFAAGEMEEEFEN